MNEDALTDMAAKVSKSLHWAALLVMVSLAILLIDLQLKRSIGRQAVDASKALSNATIIAGRMRRAASGEAAAAGAGAGRDDHHGSDPGRADVVSDTGLAAGADHAENTAEVLPAATQAGPRKRPPGNGRRTSRPDSGS